MLNYDTSRDTHSNLSTPPTGGGRPPSGRPGPYRTHERAALANALGDGLRPGEVARILAGRRVAEAFPVRWGESPEAYASRAVSEMFVAYLQ